MDRNETIARIRRALKERSGKSWSVTAGRGTAWGWLTVDAPPSRRTWRFVETGARDAFFMPITREENHPEEPFGHTSPEDRAELAALFGLDRPVHFQGLQIPASATYYREYVDRAEGRAPSVIAQPYWD